MEQASDVVGLAVTREQFLTLMKMVYIANTVANGRREDEEFLKAYDEIEQIIFAKARQAGFPAATWHHEVDGETHDHPSAMFENDFELGKLMDEYDRETFWDELALRLAERDIERVYGRGAKASLPPEEYKVLLDDRTEVYDDEFDKHDIANIRIDGVEDLT